MDLTDSPTFYVKVGSGIVESLTEAKQFIKENDLRDCYVVADNYTFHVETDSDIVVLIKKYKVAMTSDFCGQCINYGIQSETHGICSVSREIICSDDNSCINFQKQPL